MEIGRQLGKRREKFERKMGTLDRFKSVPKKFSKSQQERDQSKKGAPRENSWHIVPMCSSGDSAGADRTGVNGARVGVNVTADEKKHKVKKQRWVYLNKEEV